MTKKVLADFFILAKDGKSSLFGGNSNLFLENTGDFPEKKSEVKPYFFADFF